MHFDGTDYSIVVKNRATPSEFVEVGDLSRRAIKPDWAVIGLLSQRGDGQSGRKRGPQAIIGQTQGLTSQT
jgi:hypothetical protein